MEARQLKGLEIASTQEITREGNVWLVPSQTSNKKYTVNLFLRTCTCADFDAYGLKCKHLYAVEYLLQKESNITLPAPEKSKRKTYKQKWHEYNLSQTREKAYFMELLYQLCSLVEEPVKPRGKGRPPAPLADLVFAACLKIYCCVSGRRNQSDLDAARNTGHISRRIRYNTVFKYLELEAMTPYLQQLITESSLALKGVEVDFATDSSGFGTCQYKRWFDVKYGNTEDWHDWIKLHVMTGVRTNIVASCEITRRYAHDSPYFKTLLEATARNFQIREVSADKGYLSARSLKLTLARGAQPYIPFKSNSTTRKSTTWNRLLRFYRYNQEEFNAHYHKRSNAESTFSMIKARFGERLRSKTERAQINELLCKVLCHNICVVIQSIYELGIYPSFLPGEDPTDSPPGHSPDSALNRRSS